MSSIGKLPSKKRMVTRDQLTHMLTSGKSKLVSQAVRRSPRSKEASTPTLSRGTFARRSLFSSGTSSLPHTTTREYKRIRINRSDEEMAIVRWSMLLNNIVEKHLAGSLEKRRELESQNNSGDMSLEPRVDEEVPRREVISNSLERGESDMSLEPRVDEEVPTSRRRIQATKEKNEKGRGSNKMKVSKNSVFVDVNDQLQPIGNSQRQMSSMIGCLARDSRRLPLDCNDWRKIEREKKDAVWAEVKRSFHFPEGKEPYEWAMEKMHACCRGYKCDLKVTLFDGRNHDEAISKRPEHVPLETWANLVQYWESDKGKVRTKRGIENRGNNKMCHYGGTKTFARVRAEEEEKGNKTDKLTIWLKTHAPKKATKLDDASVSAKEAIENELSRIEEDSCNDATRDDIFKKVVGEDKYGYAKTFGIGVKLPRSTSKRCALEEERARRRKIEQEQQQSQHKVERLENKLGYVTNLVKVLLKHQGITDNVLSSFEEDDDIEGAHECGDAFEEENAEQDDQEQNDES